MNVTSSTPGRNVLSFKLSGSEKMRIASDGSVGIGTASPATTLDVSGTTTLKGTTNLSNNNIISIGNAGIGTAAPAYKLDVIGSGSDSIVCRLQSGGANTYTTYVNTGASNLDVGTGSGGHFIYGYGSYPLYFGVNGSEKMRITSAGNVGIGTSTPASLLDVNGTTTITTSTASPLTINAGNQNSYPGLVIKGGGPGSSLASGFYLQNTGTNGNTYRFYSDENGHFNINKSTSLTGITLASDGYVGIGTSAPANKLHINGTLQVDTGDIKLQWGGNKRKLASEFSDTYRNGLLFKDSRELQLFSCGESGDGGIISFFTRAATSANSDDYGTERMRITSDGRIGIGTSAPNAQLQLANTTANRKLVLWENGNNDHQYYGFGMNTSALRYQSHNGDHVFYSGVDTTSSTELMRITSAGRVGIGTSTPRFPLEVTRYVYGKYNDNGPTVMSINNSYLTSGSVNNNISISADYWIAAANFAGYSDKRIKKNIQSLQTDKCIKMIRELNPVSYNYIDYVSKSTSQMYGFIAQEVINHVSPAISYKSDYIPNLYSHVKLSKYDDNTNKSLWKVTLNKSYTETGVFTFYANKDISGNEYIGSDRYPLSDKEGNQRFKIKIIDYSLTTENEIICYTEKIINDTEFLINAESINNEYNSETIKKYNFEEKEYFLYGQEVDDFHILTYDFVWTVFASSVKEIDRQQQADKARIAELETEVVSLKQELDKQKTLINSILERLAI